MNIDLFEYVNRYVGFSKKDMELFESHLTTLQLPKKHLLIKEGQTCNSRYFIVKGCLRLFYIDPKGNEQIVHFAIDNWWISDYDSLINKIPSNMFIQAIEDTTLFELTNTRFEELCKVLPQTERLFRKIMEKSYIAAQKRLEYMFSLSGRELFETFIAANPKFAQRVPQYMIASYLGMTPEFISKIRSKK